MLGWQSYTYKQLHVTLPCSSLSVLPYVLLLLYIYRYTPRHVISLFNNQYSPPPPPFPPPPYYYIAAYRYKLDLLALANCKQQQPPLLPPFLTSITTPLNPAAWAQELENHPHQEVAQYLLQGYTCLCVRPAFLGVGKFPEICCVTLTSVRPAPL